MDERSNKITYSVDIPVPGSPGAYYTLVRAMTPEGAAECVRVILSQQDSEVVEICVRVRAIL